MTIKDKTIRPPVVVVMGHIDSGKTSLLDKIRQTKVADKESGGITQHIGAYQIEKNNKKITFIDTPGHEAFSQMRSRGAKAADIAILVIDSCKGVEKQTLEVIEHIKKAEITTIVALNKTDRPEADPAKAERELQRQGIITEALGGKTPAVKISARTGKGIDDLLDVIQLVAEMEELKTDLSQQAQGVIIESFMDTQKGPVATVVLEQGILKTGSFIGTDSVLGKLKSMESFQGKQIAESFPSDPVVIMGFENVPKVGENFKAFSSLKEAKAGLKITKREFLPKEQKLAPDQKALNIVLKTDFLGSIEAIYEVLKSLPQEKVVLKILKTEVGNINENDVKLAKGFRAIIIGFRVKTDNIANKLLQREETKVRVMTFDIIYSLVEGVRKFMEKALSQETVRTDLGKLKVLVTFWSKKNRQIVGGRVFEGEVRKGNSIEVTRNEEIIDKGKMVNLQRNKKDIEKVSKGEEAGILYEGNKKIEKGDVLIFFEKERKKAEL